MESELDMLKRQKKELEERIKVLTIGCPITLGRVKIDTQRFHIGDGGGKQNWYFLSFKTYTRDRFVSLTCGETREEVINEIPQIIEELQTFYDTYKDTK